MQGAFSMGGGLALGYGSTFGDDVAVLAAWYPATREFKDPAFASRIRVPVVMFAGTADEYKFCCMIDKARQIESAAKAANAPFQLTVYGRPARLQPAGTDYNAPATDDAFAKTAAVLGRYLGR